MDGDEARIVRIATHLLRQANFTPGGAVCRRRRNNLVDVVELQFETGDFGAKRRCTLNVGIAVPPVVSAIWTDSDIVNIAQAQCQLRLRAGDIINGVDTWWDTGDANTAARLEHALTHRVIPYLDAHTTLAEVFDSLNRRNTAYERSIPGMLGTALIARELEESRVLETLRVRLDSIATGAWKQVIAKVLHDQ